MFLTNSNCVLLNSKLRRFGIFRKIKEQREKKINPSLKKNKKRSSLLFVLYIYTLSKLIGFKFFKRKLITFLLKFNAIFIELP